MVGTGQVTNAHRADTQTLCGTGNTPYGHHIAGIHRVFHLNEHPGNHILHQLLGTKTNRQTQHTGTSD